jgi:methyl-accepting chemotaxis protein
VVNEYIKKIRDISEALSLQVDISMESSKEMEKRAANMNDNVTISIQNANTTYSEKQSRILQAIKAGKVVEDIKVMSDTIKKSLQKQIYWL